MELSSFLCRAVLVCSLFLIFGSAQEVVLPGLGDVMLNHMNSDFDNEDFDKNDSEEAKDSPDTLHPLVSDVGDTYLDEQEDKMGSDTLHLLSKGYLAPPPPPPVIKKRAAPRPRKHVTKVRSVDNFADSLLSDLDKHRAKDVKRVKHVKHKRLSKKATVPKRRLKKSRPIRVARRTKAHKMAHKHLSPVDSFADSFMMTVKKHHRKTHKRRKIKKVHHATKQKARRMKDQGPRADDLIYEDPGKDLLHPQLIAQPHMRKSMKRKAKKLAKSMLKKHKPRKKVILTDIQKAQRVMKLLLDMKNGYRPSRKAVQKMAARIAVPFEQIFRSVQAVGRAVKAIPSGNTPPSAMTEAEWAEFIAPIANGEEDDPDAVVQRHLVQKAEKQSDTEKLADLGSMLGDDDDDDMPSFKGAAFKPHKKVVKKKKKKMVKVVHHKLRRPPSALSAALGGADAW